MKSIIGLLLLGGIGYFLFTSSKVETEKAKETAAATASPTPAASAKPKPKASAAPKDVKAKEKPKTKLGNTALDMKPKKSK